MSSRIAACGQPPVSTARICAAGSASLRCEELGVLAGEDVVRHDAERSASRSVRQSARTSAVLPLPTGPPMPDGERARGEVARPRAAPRVAERARGRPALVSVAVLVRRDRARGRDRDRACVRHRSGLEQPSRTRRSWRAAKSSSSGAVCAASSSASSTARASSDRARAVGAALGWQPLRLERTDEAEPHGRRERRRAPRGAGTAARVSSGASAERAEDARRTRARGAREARARARSSSSARRGAPETRAAAPRAARGPARGSRGSATWLGEEGVAARVELGEPLAARVRGARRTAARARRPARAPRSTNARRASPRRDLAELHRRLEPRRVREAAGGNAESASCRRSQRASWRQNSEVALRERRRAWRGLAAQEHAVGAHLVRLGIDRRSAAARR